MSKLLIEESPLTFQPSLAVAIGWKEAIVLQQVQYWITNPKNTGYEQDGYKWVYNTYKDWKTENFPFWSEATIKRTFLSLEEKGLLISIQPMKNTYDREKYYRINYKQLDTFDGVNLTRSMESKRPILHYTETTSENNFNDDATHHPQQPSSSTSKLRKKAEPRIVDDATPVYDPSSSTSPPKKSYAKKAPPEPPAELKLESFAEQTLLQMLTKYKDAKKLRTPTHWQNQNQKDLFTDGAQRLTSEELIKCINYWLAKNVHSLGDLSAKVKQWADRQSERGNSSTNGHHVNNKQQKGVRETMEELVEYYSKQGRL